MTHNSDIERMLREAWNFRRIGDYSNARKLVDEARDNCGDEDFDHLGRIFHIYMQFESDHENYREALDLCRKSCSYYIRAENQSKVAHSSRHIADLQCQLEIYNESENNYNKSIEFYRNEQHNPNLANALRGYGILMSKMERQSNAIAAFLEAKQLFDEFGITEGVEEMANRIDILKK